MAKDDVPVTPAVRFLRDRRIPFRAAHYPYEEHGGTAHAARCLGADEHAVVPQLAAITGGQIPDDALRAELRRLILEELNAVLAA